MMKVRFLRYIGIDYSGAQTPTARLAGLRVFEATLGQEPVQRNTCAGDGTPAKHMRWNWTRKEIALWLAEQLAGPDPVIAGIDHGFSFPDSYFRRYGLKAWDGFLEDFCIHWPTNQDHIYVEGIREKGPTRSGRSNEFRLTEKKAKGTQSVFKFDGQGTVGKSTHAGIPWLRFLRHRPRLQGKLHFWPFDGFDVPIGKSAVVEVWPSLYRRLYPVGNRNEHEHDAYSVAKWLQEMDGNDALGRYFEPSLTVEQREVVRREGWILGV